jgi:hypothetical protein
MSLRIVKEYDRGVIFFLGKVTGVHGPGPIILIPVLEQMTRVTLRTITMNIPSQKIITKDNMSIDIAAVAYYKIIDPQKSVVAIEDITNAVNQISQTTVRNVVGQFSLDQLLSKTIDINLQIKNVIDGHTEPWGAEVTAVEIKDITLPDNMQRAMAAWPGMGIIPGSMDAKSFIVHGKGQEEAFCSCSHGAGRTMFRTAAKKRYSVADQIAATQGVECRKDADVIDEIPMAYKDIDAVMRAQSDLVEIEIVHALKQVVCVKGVNLKFLDCCLTPSVHDSTGSPRTVTFQQL